MGDLTQKMAALESLSNLDLSSFPDDPSRLKALKQARELVQRLESPWDRLTGVIWLSPARHGLLLTAIDIGLFEALEKAPSPASLDQLLEALPVKVEKQLLRRILNLLVNTGDVQAVDDRYAPSTFSTSIATAPGVKSAMLRSVDTNTASLNLPLYLKKIGYKEPADAKRGNHYDTFGTDFFTRLKEIPEKGRLFNDFMTATSRLSRGPAWWTLYPVSQLLDGYEPSNGPLMVDVGGGLGTMLESFRDTLPEPHKSSTPLVFQDLPSVIAQAQSRSLPPNVRAMEHDFFEPQPVKGARAYFMRAILHDWPDADCRIILRQLHAAMVPGYSKLLTDDRVVPAKGVDLATAAGDINMMINLDAKERSAVDWRALFESCGFRLAKIWEGPRCILEAEAV